MKLVPVHEEPEKFVHQLKRWKEDPDSEPNIEKWYQDVYRNRQNEGSKSANIKVPAFLPVSKGDPDYDDAADREQIEKGLALIPEVHKELLRKEGIAIQTGCALSRYDRRNKVIQAGKNLELGEIIHEVGDAVETVMDLYRDAKFLGVLASGIPVKEITLEYLFIETGYAERWIRLTHQGINKFVTPYQARVYPEDIDGDEMFIVSEGERLFNVRTLGEYFSEGYRMFVLAPQKLKQKDEALFEFIARLVENG